MIKFTVEDREYQWEGGYGCYFSSIERRVKQGDVRAINHIIFQARYIDTYHKWPWQAPRINWIPVFVNKPTLDEERAKMDEIKREFLKCECLSTTK